MKDASTYGPARYKHHHTIIPCYDIWNNFLLIRMEQNLLWGTLLGLRPHPCGPTVSCRQYQVSAPASLSLSASPGHWRLLCSVQWPGSSGESMTLHQKFLCPLGQCMLYAGCQNPSMWLSSSYFCLIKHLSLAILLPLSHFSSLLPMFPGVTK